MLLVGRQGSGEKFDYVEQEKENLALNVNILNNK